MTSIMILIIIVIGITKGAMGNPHVIADNAGQPKSAAGKLIPVCFTIACAAGPTLLVKMPKIAKIPTKPTPTVKAALNACATFILKHKPTIKRIIGSITIAPILKMY